MDIVAAILAGGEGTRFRPYTDIIPKPMIPLGDEEKPLLEYIVCWLRRFGIKRYVFLVGYKWKQIRNYFGSGERFGVSIRYSVDSDDYRGTGGAVLKAYRDGLLNSNPVLIWYGDIVAELDVDKLIDKHLSSDADAVIALADKYQVPVGVAKLYGDTVVDLVEKPWLDLYVSMAILTLNPNVLDGVEEHLGRSFDIMGDLIPWMLRRGCRVYAYLYKGVWYDVGSFDKYRKMDPNLFRDFLNSCVE